eukprot:CAMPEP_0184479424 /NCGR_PEP_ID=MMETSP0113_2-20130426/1159_1 /TAXON_ID=91329 /ORGANISM="Norrisiella sphaerica, Strain BC52" /LENGTH=36 /DNA_ID= /DNA_START= /DNA_END= /DNA_ORIENTATION=
MAGILSLLERELLHNSDQTDDAGHMSDDTDSSNSND